MAKLIIERKQHINKIYLEWYRKISDALETLIHQGVDLYETKNLCISVSKPGYKVTIIRRKEAKEENLVFRLPEEFPDVGLNETVGWAAYQLTRWQEHSKVSNK